MRSAVTPLATPSSEELHHHRPATPVGATDRSGPPGPATPSHPDDDPQEPAPARRGIPAGALTVAPAGGHPVASTPPLLCRAAGPGSPRRGPRVVIVGGSLTGPVMALLLLQAGFEDVTLCEARRAAQPAGGGLISLEHSALDVLDRLGVPQAEFVTCRSESIRQIEVRDRVERRSVHRTYPGRFTTWTLLHAALIARLPRGVCRYSSRVAGLHPIAAAGPAGNRPTLVLDDTGGITGTGPSAQTASTLGADLVVFADGRQSIGRRLLDRTRRLRYAGYVAHRGLAPDAGLHPSSPVSGFDADTGNGSAADDFVRLEPGPGIQFNSAPVPGGFDWTLYLNATGAHYAAMFGAGPQQRPFVPPHHVGRLARREVDEHAEQHLPPVHTTQVRASVTRTAVPVMDIDPPTRMVFPIGDGHAVLLGDALAPVRPHTARGANNGIEQAAGLAAALTQHRRHGADLAGALTGWQRRHLGAARDAVALGPRIGARLGLGSPR